MSTGLINIQMLDEFWNRPDPPPAHAETGFFTDTTLCIGCKACEVACKQWNQLPGDGFNWTGNSYDNTVALSATTWRHVAFIEQMDGDGASAALAHDERCLQALRGRALPGGLPDRLAHLQRIRQRLRAAGYLQRLRLLRGGLPVRRARPQPRGRQGAQMHALL